MVQGLQISTRADSAALTPQQKRFNTLIRQIDEARRTLAAWHEHTPLYGQAYSRLIVPLAKELAAEQRLWCFGLDRVLAQAGWTQAERATLREMLYGTMEDQAKPMRAGLALRRQELRRLDDRVGMKRWLKRQRHRRREPLFDDDFF